MILTVIVQHKSLEELESLHVWVQPFLESRARREGTWGVFRLLDPEVVCYVVLRQLLAQVPQRRFRRGCQDYFSHVVDVLEVLLCEFIIITCMYCGDRRVCCLCWVLTDVVLQVGAQNDVLNDVLRLVVRFWLSVQSIGRSIANTSFYRFERWRSATWYRGVGRTRTMRMLMTHLTVLSTHLRSSKTRMGSLSASGAFPSTTTPTSSCLT